MFSILAFLMVSDYVPSPQRALHVSNQQGFFFDPIPIPNAPPVPPQAVTVASSICSVSYGGPGQW